LTISCPRGLKRQESLTDAEVEAKAAQLGALIVRPRRKDEPGRGLHLAPIRERVESIYWTAKDILTLERHGARTLHGLRAGVPAVRQIRDRSPP
jgi:hypothetical protein